jgi:hypothetical protein
MTPLSDDEILALRRIIEDDSHATWLRKQLKVFVPAAFAVVTAIYAFVQWLIPHWRSNP